MYSEFRLQNVFVGFHDPSRPTSMGTNKDPMGPESSFIKFCLKTMEQHFIAILYFISYF